MDYFLKFPKTEFNSQQIIDISRRSIFFSKIKENSAIFTYRIVKNGERPEDIAYSEYGDAKLYWIILLFNDIVNPYTDWVMSDENLIEYCKQKYGTANVYRTHHYELDGVWVNSDIPGRIEITNLSYEEKKNEEKRKIKILKNVYIEQVKSEFVKSI